MLAILTQRNFRLLLSGQIISKLGDWLTAIALPFYVYQHTHSSLATGGMFMVQTLPMIILGSFAGVWVDRWDHRQTMLISDLLRAVISLLFVIVAITGWLWIAYLAAMLQAMLALFFDPARNAMLPSLLNADELTPANTMISAGSDLASLVGPALGGFITLKIGLGGAAGLDALTFLFSALLIYKMKAPSQMISGKPWLKNGPRLVEFWQEWREGLSVLKHDPMLRRLFMTIMIAMVGQGVINVLWIIHVNEVLKGGSVEYGAVQVAVAVGGIIGALVNAGAGKRFNLFQLIGISGMLTGLSLLFTFLIPRLTIILGLQVICGIVSIGFFISQQTLLQRSTPKAFLGRVFGIYQTTNALAFLFGEGLGSVAGGFFGTVMILSIAALLYFFAGFYAFILIKAPEKVALT